MQKFSEIWKLYEPLIKGVVELLEPFIEVAVHDLRRGKLVAIYHNISRRNVGDPSPLHELKIDMKEFPDYFQPYYKQNWDGRPLKCTSITIRNREGAPVGLICLNMDVSAFQEGFQLLEKFLGIKAEAENPIEIFGGGCEEQGSLMIEEYLGENHLSLGHLTRGQKKDVVQWMHGKGFFNFKNAVPFIAKKLKMSRATIYNHIKRV